LLLTLWGVGGLSWLPNVKWTLEMDSKVSSTRQGFDSDFSV
jgi:hypothetical protein